MDARAIAVRSFAAVMLAATSLRAQAQHAAGSVHIAGSATPLAGVVVSVLDSAGKTLTRDLSDVHGKYDVVLAANAARLRATHIGYQAIVIALPRQRSSQAALDVEMNGVESLTSSAATIADGACATGIDRRSALSLWEQARAGLLTAVVAREVRPSRERVMNYQRVIALGTGAVLDQKRRVTVGSAVRPFMAPSKPEQLATEGYVRDIADGQQFSAPDADVLLSPDFASAHCFSVIAADALHADAIGLHFEPARKQGALVDVAGTLWMDLRAPALRSLEFTYTDAQNILAFVGAGGMMHFQTMPNGIAFIDDWLVRLPVLDSSSALIASFAPKFASRSVTQRSETGGIVIDATWTDSAHWHTSYSGVTGIVLERGHDQPYAGAMVVIAATHDTVFADSLGRFSIAPLLPGRYDVSAVDTASAAFLMPRTSMAQIEVARDAPATARLNLPTLGDFLKTSCKDLDPQPNSSTIVARISDPTGLGVLPSRVQVSATWLATDRDTLRETQMVDVDDAGRFSLCGVPRERPITLTLSESTVPFVSVQLTIAPTSVITAMDWPVDMIGLARVAAQTRAVLRGHISREGSDKAVTGGDIWFPALNRHANTDSAGNFRIEGLPPGKTLVQVRGIGYGVRHDMMTLEAGAETRRDYTLQWQGQLLDEVKTVGQRFMAPGLQGFERRRTGNAGTGSFMSDSALRAVGIASLSSVAATHLPGIRLMPGTSGATYLVSARKQCVGGAGAECTVPNCYATIYRDGMLLFSLSRGDEGPPPDISRISTNEVSGVEFYPQSELAPPEFFRSGPNCGTLLLWTREKSR